MNENIEIFETAFVTADFRASNVALSKDGFAHLWPSKRTSTYREAYVGQVSEYEPLAHCLRNRYFLDRIDALYRKGEIDMLINFGCGFSMYPFLLPEKMEHIEIDMPTPISYKKERLEAWQKDGTLPKRNIHFLKANFNEAYEEELKKQILAIKKDKKTFILLEGVLFFIDREDTDRLFQLFGDLQGAGEYVGSVSFQKEIETRGAFKRLARFTKERLEANEKFNYQTVENDYYKRLNSYALVEHENTFTLADYYGVDENLPVDDVLDEHMYLLKKE